MESGKPSNLFLGIDISTQQVKAIVIDEALNTVFEESVKFDDDLPEFGTTGGAHIGADKLTVTSPTLMWVKAIDMVLEKMKTGKVKFGNIVAMSGTGQQHGSVYWKKGAREVIKNMHSEETMYSQLTTCFSVPESPIWMDSSTTKQCLALEECVGGAEKLADITGSRAYERFTGNQVAKIFQEHGDWYENTERVSLVSSFGASLFIGDYSPIDYADGSGMNLMDIRTKKWSEPCLNACGPNLGDLLGKLVPSDSVVGNISKYMVERYNFNPNCKVIAFTGDNPASLAGMRLKEGEVIVSLGTSDTLMLWLTEPTPTIEGHIFANPVERSAYMALLCYKNGSLTREKIRNEEAQGSWSKFEESLLSSKKGNDGNIGMYYEIAEIIPCNAVGVYRFNKENKQVTQFTNDEEIRAVVEGQFIAKRVHAEKLGYSVSTSTRILATGGASASKPILQVLADVFNSPVFTMDIPNSASLGCAYRAKHGYLLGEKTLDFPQIVKEAPEFTCAAVPNPDVKDVYDMMTARFKLLEDKFIRKI